MFSVALPLTTDAVVRLFRTRREKFYAKVCFLVMQASVKFCE